MNKTITALTIICLLTACGDESSTPSVECSAMPVALAYNPTPEIEGFHGTWGKDFDQMIPVSTDPAWNDTGYVSAPIVVYDEISETYRMYYTGGLMESKPGREMQMLAISDSPMGPFVKVYGNGTRGSIFELGASGFFDYDRAWGMGGVNVRDDGVWEQWYIGDSDSRTGHISRVGYATSHDQGMTWDKHYAPTETGAVFEDMTGCQQTEPPLMGMLRFPVLEDNDGYYGFYYVFNAGDIRLAYSPDGFTDWQIVGNVNVPVPVTGIGNVVKDGDIYYMAATHADFRGVVILTSVDKVNWAEYDELRISAQPEWASEWMAYPYLFKDPKTGDWYLYFVGSDPYDDGFNGRIGVAVLQ